MVAMRLTPPAVAFVVMLAVAIIGGLRFIYWLGWHHRWIEERRAKMGMRRPRDD